MKKTSQQQRSRDRIDELVHRLNTVAILNALQGTADILNQVDIGSNFSDVATLAKKLEDDFKKRYNY